MIVSTVVLVLSLTWMILSDGKAAEFRSIIALLTGAGVGGAGGYGYGLHKGKQSEG